MHLRKSTIGGVGILVLAALAFGLRGDATLSAGRPQTGVAGLFVDAPQRVLRNARVDGTVVRSRHVTIDFAALVDPGVVDIRMAARPALLLNVFDDASFTAVRDRIDQAENGFTWVGHIPGIDLSTVTLASVDGVVSGSIVMPEAVYAIRYVGDGVHAVDQIDQSKFQSELDPIPVDAPDAGMTVARDAGGLVAMDDDGSTIDVLVLYTPAAAADAGGTTAMATRVNLGISETNTSYINSGIAQRLRLVNSQQVAYSESNNLTLDLYAVTNSGSHTSLGDTAASLRDTYSADLVMLITSPVSASGCGVAWLMSSVSSGFAPNGFSVVKQSCISPNYTFAHELGHNMGARHDWYVDNGKTPGTWAHGYVLPTSRWRTVMAYNDLCPALLGPGNNCARLLYWANPAVNAPAAYGSAPMGIAGGTKSDCPKGDITNFACDADDHLTLNSTAFTIANFRQSAGTPQTPVTPVITWADPASVVAGTVLGATQLNATATVSESAVAGAFVYNPPAGTVLAAGNQTLSVTFTPTDFAAYTTAAKTVTIIVCGSDVGSFVGPPCGGWSGTISGGNLLYRGGTYQVVNGRVNFPDCTTYIVGPNGALIGGSSTPNCTPSGGGLIRPTLTWATPAAVTVGTVLSGTQLNATSGVVAGSFAYAPPLGTVMNAVGSQTLSVTFTPTDGATYAAATGSVTLVVTASGSFIGPAAGGGWSGTISGGNLLYRGGTYPIVNGRVNFPDCTTYIVAPNGALMGGSATPNCTPGGGGGLITPTITWTTPASVTVGTVLSATQLNASSGGVAGNFEYTPTFAAVMNTVGNQTLSVTFTPTDGATYAAAATTVTLVVTASGGGGGSFVGPPSGGWSGTVSGSNFVYNGRTFPIVNGRVNFPDCTTFIVAPNGALMGGSATPNCTPGGAGGGGTLITPTITWPIPSAVTVGTLLSGAQLNASSGGVAGTFAYTPTFAAVMNTVGSQTLSVTFTPTDGATYGSATALVTLQVTSGSFVGPREGGGWSGTISGSNLLYNGGTYQVVNGRVNFPDCTTFIVAPNGALMGGSATPNCTPGGGGGELITPTLTWATPAAVTVGTLLSGTQLNASSSGVAGTFVYTPPLGTPMNTVGNQALSVAFTPTDGATYAAATGSVTLVVTASGSFVGPAAGGGWSGTISGSNFVYNGRTFSIVNGRVNFPDCTTFIVGPNGALMGGSATPNCTPSDR